MERIVAGSKKMLAPVTRRDEDNTLTCGHFAQFANADEHGCPTPFANSADRFVNRNKAQLTSLDEEFKYGAE